MRRLVFELLVIFQLFNEHSLSKLCNIQLIVNSIEPSTLLDLDKINSSYEEYELQSDTIYRATCVTDERVRLRNILSLESSSSQVLVSNKTLASPVKAYSYLSGSFAVKRNQINSNNILFCRFLTQNTSVYCEKTVRIRVADYANERMKTFLVLAGLLSLITLLNVIMYLVKTEHKMAKSDDNKEEVTNETATRTTISTPHSPILFTATNVNSIQVILDTSKDDKLI